MILGIGKVPNPNGTQLPLPLFVLLFNVHIVVRVRSKDEANRSKTGKVMMIGCYCCLQARFRCYGLSNGSVYQFFPLFCPGYESLGVLGCSAAIALYVEVKGQRYIRF